MEIRFCSKMNDSTETKLTTRKHHVNSAKGSKRKTRNRSPKIIDLNVECLVKIFDYLDLQSLFNVAVASEWLRSAAGEVHQRKFGMKKVHINADKSNALENWLNCVRIQGLQTSLQYLRCFGPSILSLTIDYTASWSSQRHDHVHHYINKYCAKSLVGIVFWHMPPIAITQFADPFAKVLNAVVWNGDLGGQLPSFVEWFPNLKSLYIDDVRVNDGFSRASFQQLQHLCISLNDENGFKTTQMTCLLRFNRQLRHLQILSGDQQLQMTTLLKMTECNPFISELSVMTNAHYSNGNAAMPMNPAHVQRFATEHPLLVRVNLRHLQFSTDDVLLMIRQIKTLRTFNFQMEQFLTFMHLQLKLNNKWTAQSFGWCPTYVQLQRNR